MGIEQKKKGERSQGEFVIFGVDGEYRYAKFHHSHLGMHDRLLRDDYVQKMTKLM